MCLSADWTGSPVPPFNPLHNQGTVNSFFGCVCPQTGQVHSHLFYLQLSPFQISVLVCLSADWTSSPVLVSQTPVHFASVLLFSGVSVRRLDRCIRPPFYLFGFGFLFDQLFPCFWFSGCVCPQTGQVHSPPLFWFVCAFCSSVSRVPVQPRFSITVLVCLSADWTGAFVPFFFACNTKAVFSTVLVCLSTDVTGSPVPFTHYYQGIFLLYSCVCPQTGQVHLYSLYCTPTVFHSPNLVWHH